jgi:hypothetical protein
VDATLGGVGSEKKPDRYDEKFSLDADPEDALRGLLKGEPEPIDPRAKEATLRRLRDAPEGELAVFGDALREDALRAGATEQEVREAQTGHPEHG